MVAFEETCEFEVEDRHRQPWGLVHGGVYCGVIESVASIGATLFVRDHGQVAVGLENHTSFIRAAAAGRLFAVARPVSRGRTNQVWEVSIRDEKQRVIARGTVRLQNVSATPPSSVQP